MQPRYPALRARYLVKVPRDGHRWTAEEQKILIEHWPEKSAKAIGVLLGRSEKAVRRRTRMLETEVMTLCRSNGTAASHEGRSVGR